MMKRILGPARCAVVLIFLNLLAVGCSGIHPSAATPSALGTELCTGWRLQDIAAVSDPGSAVSSVGYSPAKWHKATVPGTVLTSLVNEGIYPEPLFGENNRPDKIPDSLCRTSYWCRTEFTAPKFTAGEHVWLNFDGINYKAEIWVNGQRVGDIAGAFARGIFDISRHIQSGATVAVAVLIKPPPNPAAPLEQTVRNGLGLNGGIHSHDGPTFISTQGWDWIPGIRDRDMGIWQKVTITKTGAVTLRDPHVVTDLPLPKTDSADISIEATVRNVSPSPKTGIIRGTLGDAKFQSEPITLGADESRLVKLSPSQIPSLHIKNPKLWWPNGYGDPHLYPLHLFFDIDNESSDSKSLNVGIREITYSLPGNDNLLLVVNGVPVFAKGGNWGMDEAMKRIPRERLDAQIRFHKEANYTIIRNWVGQSTSEDFYDLCDKYGILIWDEFFQPNPSDSGRAPGGRGARGATSATSAPARALGDDDISDVPMYLANVREKVLRFRNHPSIALWCGRNEGVPTPASINEGNAAILKELNPERLYQASSTDGRGVRSGGPYAWRAPQLYYADRGITAGRGARGGRGAATAPAPASAVAASAPTSRPAIQSSFIDPFKTELGSVSIPTLESIKAMLPEKDWNPIPANDAWASHDLARGANNGDTFPRTLALRYGVYDGLPGFVRKAQLANYESHRALYEGRLARMFNPANAVFLWMSNPAQPSFTWQIYSYDLEPFSSFFAAKKACEPVHIMMNQYDNHLMVVNHTPKPLAGLSAIARVFNLSGELKHEMRLPLSSTPSSTLDLGAVPFPQDVSRVHFVKLELRDASSRLISENFYWRGTTPDDLTALDTLGPAALGIRAVRKDAADKCLIDLTLTNDSDTIAVMTHAQLRRSKSGQRVLPVFYSDNYISLLPGESRTVRIEAASKDLAGEKPALFFDGWNIRVKDQTLKEVDIRLNTEAILERSTLATGE